jgi:signal peptidase II
MLRKPQFFGVLVLAGIAADLISKAWLFGALREEHSYPLWRGVLHLTLRQNRGVAFSMLENQQWLIGGISVLAIGFMAGLYWQLRHTAPLLMLLALALVLAGAAGNFYDRCALGYVRDFLDFVPPLPLIGRWAVFNIADTFITVGVIMIFVAEIFLRKPEQAGESEKAKGESRASL